MSTYPFNRYSFAEFGFQNGLKLAYFTARSEEHTSELQSHSDLVCRLLLEKKKNKNVTHLLLITTTTHTLFHL